MNFQPDIWATSRLTIEAESANRRQEPQKAPASPIYAQIRATFADYPTQTFTVQQMSVRIRADFRETRIALQNMLYNGNVERHLHGYRLSPKGFVHSEEQVAAMRLRIIEFLRQNPDGASLNQIATHLGKKPRHAYNITFIMEQHGMILPTGKAKDPVSKRPVTLYIAAKDGREVSA